MTKKNCWEIKQCGRGPTGNNDCSAAQDSTLNGVHGGLNAGRSCWVVAGTSCESGPSGTFAKEIGVCFRCEFFRLVEAEEQLSKTGFSATKLGMVKILQGAKPAQHAQSPREAHSEIDHDLRNEFAQEVNRMVSGTHGDAHDEDAELKKEFAREVERLTSKSDNK